MLIVEPCFLFYFILNITCGLHHVGSSGGGEVSVTGEAWKETGMRLETICVDILV